MTREEAISIMNVIVHMLEPQYDTDRIEDAVEKAIKALEQEPCDDAISRQAAVNIASGFCHPANIADELAKLPSVNPQDCDTCEVGNPCLYCKHEFEPQESEVSDADSD